MTTPLVLARLDANLLVALDVLLQERHVTRAAQHLGVTQSAMSQTLQRLRTALDDPLLVRSGGKMVPTPRALAIAAPLRLALTQLERAITPEDTFDPATATRAFRVAFLDVYAVSLAPALFTRIAAAGSDLSMDVLPLSFDEVFDQLRSGALDIAVAGPMDFPSDIHTAHFIAEQMLSMVRDDHPILAAPVTLTSFCAYPHVAYRISGRGAAPFDRRLERQGHRRRLVGRLPYFLAAPFLVQGSDLIIGVPRSAGRVFARRWPVRLFEPPFDRPIRYDVSLAWHARLDADPAMQWLRQELSTIGAALSHDLADVAPDRA